MKKILKNEIWKHRSCLQELCVACLQGSGLRLLICARLSNATRPLPHQVVDGIMGVSGVLQLSRWKQRRLMGLAHRIAAQRPVSSASEPPSLGVSANTCATRTSALAQTCHVPPCRRPRRRSISETSRSCDCSFAITRRCFCLGEDCRYR